MSASPVNLPSPNATSEAANSALGKALELTTQFATSWIGTLTTYVAGVGAAFFAFRTLKSNSDLPVSGCAAIVLALLALVFLFHTLPTLQEQRRKERLKQITGSAETGYFQLAPREDEAAFRRADGKHNEVLNWLRRPPKPVLYLTGSSGTGKSSLLAAWVLPKLEREGVRIIRLRGYQDPAKVLEEELKRPGVIWKRTPPESTDLNILFEEARKRVLPSRLLVVFDQFEEFLILQEAQQRARFVQFLIAQAAEPDTGASILLSFRTEYDGFIQELKLPVPIPGQNLQKVQPFTEIAARDFLLGSGLGFDEKLQAGVLREAAEVEETKGLIRPITLNLCGLVLSRFAMGLPAEFRAGRLIRGFVRESIFQREISDVSRILLPKLISRQVTKQPKSLEELAAGTDLTVKHVQGAMFKLGEPERAIVRPLDPEHCVWEISHDFLVPMIDSLLAQRRVSFWKTARPWLPTFGLGLLLLVCFAGHWMYPDPIGNLSEHGWDKQSVRNGITGRISSYNLFFSSPVSSSSNAEQIYRDLEQSYRDLARIMVPFTITVSGIPAFDSDHFDKWKHLRGLTALTLHGSALVNISGLHNLVHVKNIDISDTHINNAQLANLPEGVTQLNISDTAIDERGLKNLPQTLTALKISHNNIDYERMRESLPSSLTRA